MHCTLLGVLLRHYVMFLVQSPALNVTVHLIRPVYHFHITVT